MYSQVYNLSHFTHNLPDNLKNLLGRYSGWRGIFDKYASEWSDTTPQAKLNFIREVTTECNISFEELINLYYYFTMSRYEWQYRIHGLPPALDSLALCGCTEALNMLEYSDWPVIKLHRECFEKHSGRLSLVKPKRKQMP